MTFIQKHTGTTHALHAALSSWTKTLWIAAAVLFLCYLYFVGAITFAVVSQRSHSASVKQLVSTIAYEEQQYLDTQRTLTKAFAANAGFTTPTSVAFATPKRALAWNAGR